MRNKRNFMLLFLFSIFLIESCEKKNLPVADFSIDKPSSETGVTIYFINNSQNATGYTWDFGDGSTSTEKNPSHSYSTTGSFTVTLTATGDGGTNTTSKTITISHPLAIASFSMDKTTAEVGVVINFTNTSLNALSYSWDFGDGKSSTATNPTHSYTAAGTFTVTLTATGQRGNNTTSKTITITAPTNRLLGTWNLTGGTFGGTAIASLSGYRFFGSEAVSGGNWTGNSRCNMVQGTDRGTVYGAYEISGTTLKYGYNMTAISWTGNTTNFSKFGVVGLGLQNVTYSITGDVLTITGVNSYGTTVLTYQKQ